MWSIQPGGIFLSHRVAGGNSAHMQRAYAFGRRLRVREYVKGVRARNFSIDRRGRPEALPRRGTGSHVVVACRYR